MSAIHLIRGCPGAGKTRTLSQKAAAAVEAYGASQVAIASLTKTAAAEIAGRDTHVPDQNVGTLHAHCYRALECERDEMAETAPRLREFAGEHPEYEAPSNGADLDDATGQATGLHAAVQNHRARCSDAATWTQDERDYHTAWSAWKAKHGLRDFTDLVERCADEPELMPAVQGLFFDESQDFSALELRLALGWAARVKTTVVCADVDQAIFQWRGADPGALEALPYGVTLPLLQSYRCSRAVRDLALGWISQIPGRRDTRWEPTEHEGSVHQAPFALQDTDDLLEQIAALDGSVMILTSCGYMLDPVLHALRAAGLPYANPHRIKEARWNPTRSQGYRALGAYLRTDTKTHGEQAGARTWADLLAWTSVVQSKGYLARGAKAAVEEHCRPDQFKQTRAGEPVPLGTLIELLGTPIHPALRNDVDWFEDALMAKHRKAGGYACDVWRREPGMLLAEPRVTVGTTHSVKGASADRVIVCPELSKEGYFGEGGWHGNGRDSIIRQFYVACTRARQSVHVLEPAVSECVPLWVDDAGRLAA